MKVNSGGAAEAPKVTEHNKNAAKALKQIVNGSFKPSDYRQALSKTSTNDLQELASLYRTIRDTNNAVPNNAFDKELKVLNHLIAVKNKQAEFSMGVIDQALGQINNNTLLAEIKTLEPGSEGWNAILSNVKTEQLTEIQDTLFTILQDTLPKNKDKITSLMKRYLGLEEIIKKRAAANQAPVQNPQAVKVQIIINDNAPKKASLPALLDTDPDQPKSDTDNDSELEAITLKDISKEKGSGDLFDDDPFGEDNDELILDDLDIDFEPIKDNKNQPKSKDKPEPVPEDMRSNITPISQEEYEKIAKEQSEQKAKNNPHSEELKEDPNAKKHSGKTSLGGPGNEIGIPTKPASPNRTPTIDY